MMKKRLLCMLLCLVMLLSMLPTVSAAEPALQADLAPTASIDCPENAQTINPNPPVGNVYMVGNVALQAGQYLPSNSQTPTTTKPSGGYIYHRPDGGLDMYNYTFTGDGYTFYTNEDGVKYQAAVYSPKSIPVTVYGTNTLNLTETSEDITSVGIVADEQNLTIMGPDKLTVNADCGLVSYGDRVSIVDATVTLNCQYECMFSVYASKIIRSTATLNSDYCAISQPETITQIFSSTVRLNSTGLGIETDTLEMEKSTLTMTTADLALYASGTATLDQSTVSINSGTDGIYHEGNQFALQDSTLTISAAQYGMIVNNLSIYNGKLAVNSGDIAVYCPEGNIYIYVPCDLLYPRDGFIGVTDDGEKAICDKDGYAATDVSIGIPFADVVPGSFYEDAVYTALGTGITTGTSTTTFSPNKTCTRAEAVTFLWRACGKPAPESTEIPFSDVPANAYYTAPVLWAMENGITSGTGGGRFSPNKICTRGEIVTFLWRAANQPAPGSTEIPFTDLADGAFYTYPVLWAVENGITSGTGGTNFSPDKFCSRSEIVTFLYRWMQMPEA